MIHWEMCKKFKFDYPVKWYMHKPESALENEMHKVLWCFEIQIEHLLPDKRQDFNKKQMKNLPCHDFTIPANHRVKIKTKRIERQVPRPCLWTRRVKEHEGDDDTNYNWCVSNGFQRLEKLSRRTGYCRTTWDLQTTALLKFTKILRIIQET